MEDEQIIDLYWARSEDAIHETAAKYGRYCSGIANNILYSHEDADECVNDTYLRAWNSIPPTRPSVFRIYLGHITRNLALNMFEKNTAIRRGNGQTMLVLEELEECIPSSDNVDHIAGDLVFAGILNGFLATLTDEQRKFFVRRYWYLSSIKEIATDYNCNESKVKMSLLRTRGELKTLLEKEGIRI